MSKVEEQHLLDILKSFGENSPFPINKNVDHNIVISLAEQQDLLTLVQFCANKAGITSYGDYHETYDNLRRTMLKRIDTIYGLILRLRKEDIPFAILKGPSLSQIAYGDFGFRSSRDIDFLIDTGDLPKIRSLFNEFSFSEGKYDKSSKTIKRYSRQQSIAFSLNTHQIGTMVKLDRDFDGSTFYTTIDTNFNLTWGGYDGKCIDTKRILSSTFWTSHDGYEYPILREEEYLLQLCLHLFKEANGFIYLTYKRGMSIKAFLDVYLFLNNAPSAFSIERFLKLVMDYELDDYIYFAFFYVKYLFGSSSEIENILTHVFPTDPSIVNKFGLSKMEKKSWGNIEIYDRFFSSKSFKHINDTLTGEEHNKLEIIRNRFY